MPLYSLECHVCGDLDEYIIGVPNGTDPIPCEACGAELTRMGNRAYYADRVMIQGDTCAGSCNFSNYYDDALDMHIDSRDHRKRVMEEKGLTEYSPNPEMKAARTEARYILDNSPKGDKTALDAARQQSRDVDGKRKERVIGAAMDKARKVAESN